MIKRTDFRNITNQNYHIIIEWIKNFIAMFHISIDRVTALLPAGGRSGRQFLFKVNNSPVRPVNAVPFYHAVGNERPNY